MREAEEREIFQNAVDRRLSGLQENPFLAQRIMNAEKGEIKVKKKLTMSMALVIVLLLIAVTALAVALLSPKEIVEQVAVPVAQNNDHENYTYEELAELIRAASSGLPWSLPASASVTEVETDDADNYLDDIDDEKEEIEG